MVLAPRSNQRPLRPATRIRRQLARAFLKRGARCQAAPRPRPPGRVLQFGGDVLVQSGSRLSEVPRTPIRIEIGVSRIGERAMHKQPLIGRACAIDGRSHQRMAEAHMRAELDQSGRHRRGGRVVADTQRARRLPHQHRITQRLGRRDQK